MTHLSSIGAGVFSDLSICVDSAEIAAALASPTEANLKLAFATELANGSAPTAGTGEFIRIKNVREFPAMGTPPNVVNVPGYGSKTSSQIQGQADAPSMELTLNYVGTDWQKTANYLGMMVGDGTKRLFRFTLMNSQPSGYISTNGAGGVGTVENSQYYWFGKIEALQVAPQLTDANTATITITIQSELYGAFTSAGV